MNSYSTHRLDCSAKKTKETGTQTNILDAWSPCLTWTTPSFFLYIWSAITGVVMLRTGSAIRRMRTAQTIRFRITLLIGPVLHPLYALRCLLHRMSQCLGMRVRAAHWHGRTCAPMVAVLHCCCPCRRCAVWLHSPDVSDYARNPCARPLSTSCRILSERLRSSEGPSPGIRPRLS